MKLKFLSLFAIVLLSATSCKKEEKKETDSAVEAPAVKENFVVELTASAAKKDDFAVYYTEDGTNNFDGKNAVWHGIAGDNKQETLVFDIPVAATPTNIRMDFGLNKDQETVEVYNIRLSFLGKDQNIKGSEFFNYFIKDENFKTELDSAKGTMRIAKQGAEFKTPYFYPRQELIDAIKNLINPAQ